MDIETHKEKGTMQRAGYTDERMIGAPRHACSFAPPSRYRPAAIDFGGKCGIGHRFLAKESHEG